MDSVFYAIENLIKYSYDWLLANWLSIYDLLQRKHNN